MANQQIVFAPSLYLDNLQVSWASNTTLTVAAGAARNSTNIGDIIVSAPLTLNAAVNGVNGLDSGALANSTWYYVYAIGDSTLTKDAACLLSTSATAPYMPSGYDMFRLIDVQRTNGSAQLLLSYNQGNDKMRTKTWDATVSVLSSGTATSLTLVSLDAGVPPLAQIMRVRLGVVFIPNAAGDSVLINYPGSTSIGGAVLSGSVASVAQAAQLEAVSAISSSVQKIQYKNSAASCTSAASVISFVMSL